jgi:hypothetical protein
VPIPPGEECGTFGPDKFASFAARRTLYTRLNNKLSGAIVLIMHRLHEDDLGCC